MNQTHTIPRFFLYEDQHSDVELDFLHIEPIRERSGLHDWTIRPHSHPDHTQFLLVTNGNGWTRMEENRWEFSSTSLVIIPAGIVHEIGFEAHTDGFVITAAFNYLKSTASNDRRLLDVCLAPAVFPLDSSDQLYDGIADAFSQMNDEFVWSAIGRRSAIMALFIRILVYVLRVQSNQEIVAANTPNKDYDLVMRYREMLEQYFRHEKNLEFYASKLGVTLSKLNIASKSRLGKTSSELLYERMVVEAKRYLLYSEMSVAEIGHSIGFDDPAYFSRFFSKRVGSPPGTYRREAAAPHTKK